MTGTPSPTDGVPAGLRPLVWLAAVLWLPVRLGLRAGDRCLEAYEHGADAAWQALVRAVRRVVHWLGPLGRGLRRALRPVWRLVRRAWDRVGLWVLLRMLAPLRRGVAWLLQSLRPLAVRVRRAMAAVLDRLEPVWEAVLRGTAHVDLAVVRVGRRLTALWGPVARAVGALSGRPTARGRSVRTR